MIKVGKRLIGKGAPCFVVAEAGINHNGDPALARELIRQAARSGADAVKFQIFHAEKLVDEGTPEFDLFKKHELSRETWKELALYAEKEGIIFMATPFDLEAVELLEEIGVLAYKIASGDITNFELISEVARKWKPIFLSTGGATLSEVSSALESIYGEENDRVILLHCVSCYPVPDGEVNLRAINDLWEHFFLPVGFSDHTLGMEAALVAVAIGACVVEKHFTLDKSLPGPDHVHSLTPSEFSEMVKKIRKIEKMLGNGRKEPMPCETEFRFKGRRSLKAAVDIPAGTVIERNMLVALRPRQGIGVEDMVNVVGRRARRSLVRGESIRWEDLE